MADNKTFNIDGGFKILPGVWRNFSGEARRYNREGSRNFNIEILDSNLKADLEKEGYVVKEIYPKDEDGKPNTNEEPTRFLKVNINFNDYGPKIYLYSKEAPHGVLLTEETVSQLDNADILDCSMKIRAYHYDTPTGSGITAYLNEMNVKVQPNKVAERFGFQEEPMDISDQGPTF